MGAIGGLPFPIRQTERNSMIRYALRGFVSAALLSAMLGALAFLGLRPALAQYGYVSITTDRTQYQISDTVRMCYTVGGPGPVTITDIQGGMSHALYSFVDDGRG